MKQIGDNKNLSDLNYMLGELKSAFIKCAIMFDKVDESELNDIIADGYPFNLSFEDQTPKVVEWVEKSQKKIRTTVLK